MPILPIRLFPDPVLRKPAQRIASFDQKLAQLIQTMDTTMRAQASGIGIAAPQVGISLQLAIIDVSSRISGATRLILANPRVLERKNEKISREGCMSLPEYTGNLIRHDQIRLRWQDGLGRDREGVFQGLEAVCIQHEIDHLEGKLFIDRISFLNRDLIPRQFASKSRRKT
jgi:peptide deformylase